MKASRATFIGDRVQLKGLPGLLRRGCFQSPGWEAPRSGEVEANLGMEGFRV